MLQGKPYLAAMPLGSMIITQYEKQGAHHHPRACHAHAMHARCRCHHHVLAPCPCPARAVQARTSYVGCSTCATTRRHASCRATPAPLPAAGRSSGQGASRRLLGRWTQADSWARGQHGREALASRWPLLERRVWPGIEGSPSPPNHHLWPRLWRAGRPSRLGASSYLVSTVSWAQLVVVVHYSILGFQSRM